VRVALKHLPRLLRTVVEQGVAHILPTAVIDTGRAAYAQPHIVALEGMAPVQRIRDHTRLILTLHQSRFDESDLLCGHLN
jgi:hypothetical protein